MLLYFEKNTLHDLHESFNNFLEEAIVVYSCEGTTGKWKPVNNGFSFFYPLYKEIEEGLYGNKEGEYIKTLYITQFFGKSYSKLENFLKNLTLFATKYNLYLVDHTDYTDQNVNLKDIKSVQNYIYSKVKL